LLQSCEKAFKIEINPTL